MKKSIRLVVTAGPTREHLDPVRFLSNPSTGKMGFAIAAEAARRGHDVTLVAGPVSLKTPKGVNRVDVVSAREMLAASKKAFGYAANGGACAFVATAAVADWRPAKCAKAKLKKGAMRPVLELRRNPDVLKTVSGIARRSGVSHAVMVGFAAETGDAIAEASRKCREKGLSFIVANDVSEKGCGFGTDTNRVSFVFPGGEVRRLPMLSKRRVAAFIVKEIESC